MIYEIVGIALWVWCFTLFDWIGFVWLDNRKGTILYRFVQGAFQTMISLVLWYVLGSWVPVLSANIIWLFLGCDVLFYWVDGSKLTPFTWFTWSPVNFLYQIILGKPTPVYAIWASVIIGVVISCSILLIL